MDTRQIAKFVCETGFEDMPAEVRKIATDLVLDYFAVALAGSVEDVSLLTADYARTVSRRAQAGVVGQGFRTETSLAALVNGTCGHALDYDDYTLETMAHPTVAILPAALSVGEQRRASGRDVLAAYILGFEVASKIGSKVAFRHYQAGWHCTGTLCSLGAVAAAGKLMKLDYPKMLNAFGIAASMAGGLRENFGTMTKPLHAGRAAQNGVAAASLAEKGFTASDHILEADLGFNRALAGGQNIGTEKEALPLGAPYSMISPGVTLKPYPSCGMTHCGIDAALEMHRLYHLKPEDIAGVELTTHPMVPTVVFHHQPHTGPEARFSLEFCVSRALVRGELSMNDFSDAVVMEPASQELAGKVKYGEYAKDQEYGPQATVAVTTRDGRRLVKRVEVPRGAPGNPMTGEEMRKKFRDCAASAGVPSDRAERIIGMISGFPGLKGIGPLMKLAAAKN